MVAIPSLMTLPCWLQLVETVQHSLLKGVAKQEHLHPLNNPETLLHWKTQPSQNTDIRVELTLNLP
eukprot:319918-Amphidinium_carterae.1